MKNISKQIQNLILQKNPQKDEDIKTEFIDFNKSIQEMLEEKFPLKSKSKENIKPLNQF